MKKHDRRVLRVHEFGDLREHQICEPTPMKIYGTYLLDEALGLESLVVVAAGCLVQSDAKVAGELSLVVHGVLKIYFKSLF